MKLSKREILLLLLLAFLLLFVVGVQWILLPTYQQYQDDQQQMVLLEASHTSLQRQVANSEAVMTRLGEAQVEAAALASQYEAIMANYDADHYLYDLMEAHRLTARALEIADLAERAEITYMPGGQLFADASVDLAELAYTPIEATVMMVELEGTWQQIFESMTAVDTHPSRIRIAGFELEDPSSHQDGVIVKGTAQFIIYYAKQ